MSPESFALSFRSFALSFRTPTVYVNVLSAAKNLIPLRINSAKRQKNPRLRRCGFFNSLYNEMQWIKTKTVLIHPCQDFPLRGKRGFAAPVSSGQCHSRFSSAEKRLMSGVRYSSHLRCASTNSKRSFRAFTGRNRRATLFGAFSRSENYDSAKDHFELNSLYKPIFSAK